MGSELLIGWTCSFSFLGDFYVDRRPCRNHPHNDIALNRHPIFSIVQTAMFGTISILSESDSAQPGFLRMPNNSEVNLEAPSNQETKTVLQGLSHKYNAEESGSYLSQAVSRL